MIEACTCAREACTCERGGERGGWRRPSAISMGVFASTSARALPPRRRRSSAITHGPSGSAAIVGSWCPRAELVPATDHLSL